MFSIQDQFSNATRNHLESQFRLMSSIGNNAFESMQQLSTLHFAAAKMSLQESNVLFSKLVKTQNAREFFTLSAEQIQPGVEKTIAYSRHIARIASDAQAGFIDAAETQFDETRRNMMRLMEDLAKSAPTGSETAVSIVRSAVETGSTGYEQLTRTAKHAVTVVRGTLDAATVEKAPATNVIIVSE